MLWGGPSRCVCVAGTEVRPLWVGVCVCVYSRVEVRVLLCVCVCVCVADTEVRPL